MLMSVTAPLALLVLSELSVAPIVLTLPGVVAVAPGFIANIEVPSVTVCVAMKAGERIVYDSVAWSPHPDTRQMLKMAAIWGHPVFRDSLFTIAPVCHEGWFRMKISRPPSYKKCHFNKKM